MESNFKPLASLLDAGREAPLPPTSPPNGSDTKPEKVSGVPVRRANDTFDNFNVGMNPDMVFARAQCMKVANRDAWCALLAGPPGTGKTHLAVAAMNRYGIMRSMFWKVPDYLDWLRTWAYDKSYQVDQLTRPYREQDFLLVLDDLGVENQTDWASEQLYRVLDSRYDNTLPTIITTNQTPAKLDGRLLSRYSEGLIVCKGTDVRRR